MLAITHKNRYETAANTKTENTHKFLVTYRKSSNPLLVSSNGVASRALFPMVCFNSKYSLLQLLCDVLLNFYSIEKNILCHVFNLQRKSWKKDGST